MRNSKLTSKRILLFLTVIVILSGAGLYWLTRADAAAPVKYGAGANDDSTGAYGYSYNYATRAEANAAALRQCGRPGCNIKVEFYDGCGAFAKDSSSGTAYGWGIADTSYGAQNRALAECQRRGGTCYIAVWGCTSR